MSDELSLVEMRMIQAMIKNKSYLEIAGIMDRPEAIIKEYVLRFKENKDIVTKQDSLDERAKLRASKKKVHAETLERDQAVKSKLRRLKEKKEVINSGRIRRKTETVFATKQVNYSKMIAVRIDKRTVLQIPADSDVDTAIKKFNQRIKHVSPSEPAYKIVKKFKPE